MRIEHYEKMKANLAALEAKRQEDNAKRATAAADVAAAKKKYDDLLEQAAAGGYSDETAAQVSKAQGAVLIAEKRQEQLKAQLGDGNQAPALSGLSVASVRSEIAQQIRDGRLLAEFQPVLDELATIRAQYLDKLAEVLNTRARINRELRDIQYETLSMAGERLDFFGSTGPAQLSLDDLRKWVWLYDDLGEATRRLETEAYEAVNGPGYTGKGVTIPDKITFPDDQPTHVVHYQNKVVGAIY